MPDHRTGEPTPASHRLLALARRVAGAYVATVEPHAMFVTGSAAQGTADRYSDLDLIAYYDELPSEEVIATARRAAGGGELRVLGAWDGSTFGESFPVDGVECQVGHATLASVEREIATVLVDLDVDSPFQKALDGVLRCVPLHGQEHVRSLQARVADYPDALGRAMVERHLSFFPLWCVEERMATRDASLFRQQVLVESAQHLLGILAGLNRVYHSSFQFKRLHAFAGRLAQAPPDFADRMDRLLTGSPDAGAELEALVGETLALVERAMPGVDVGPARLWLGRREEPWNLSP